MKKDVNRFYLSMQLGKKKEKELYKEYDSKYSSYKTYYSFLFELYTYYYYDTPLFILMLPKTFSVNDIEKLHKCLDYMFIYSSGL